MAHLWKLFRLGVETVWNDRLACWFGLSRASFLTLPRVLMHEMPDEWQEKMAELLEQYDSAFPNQPDIGTLVVGKKGNKFIKFPDWVTNYRHPIQSEIEKLKETQS